ncbi:AAA family ATPase [Aquisalimonas sp.]|uniref:AAA family ATPase n=1 Tax=Aquisalimonas sp. TaxID=1872621 RepID=UPI0025BEF4AD|nr:AAA family ATPase [Aquisalimonas sp.]
MRLDALHIRRLPGIDRALHLETFGPGVNVITGPNASGKSSLLRALRMLIAPRSDDPGNVLLEAAFTRDGEHWRAERFGRDVVWLRDGATSEPPPLPAPDTLGGYFLPVDELLHRTRSDAAIAAQLRRELAGGYDLAALRAEGGPLPVHPRRDRQAGEALKAAEQTLREAESGNRTLLADRERLPDLRVAIQRATEALQRRDHCHNALALVDAREATRAARARLGAFPEVMPEGIDARELERLEQRRDQERERARAAREAMEAASERLRDTGLADEADGGPYLAPMRRRLDEIRDLTARLEQAREQLQRDTARVTENEQLIGDADGNTPRIDQQSVARLEEAAQTLSRALGHWHQLGAGADTTEADGPTTNRSRRVVWLDRLAVAATGMAVAVLAYAGYSGSPALTLAATGSAGAGLAWLLWRSLPGAASAVDPHQEQRTWAARGELEDARTALRSLAADMGLALDTDTLPNHLQLLVQRLLRLDEARIAREESQARCDHLDRNLAPLRDELTHFLATWQSAAASQDITDLTHALEQLERRAQTAADARHERARAEDEATRATAAEQEASAALEQLYARAGIANGDRETLLARLDELPAWREAKQALHTATVREDDARARLQTAPDDLRSLADADDRANLTAELQRATAQSEEHDTLVREEERIHQRLRDAERRFRLEQARADRDEARDALAERLDQRMVAEAGRFLLEDVEADHRREHQPRAARLADQWLRRFTHEQFALELDDHGEPCAREAGSGELRALEALSVGTRMQLLLALRMAWVEEQEHGNVPLPLMLDEALATTDPLRFDAVATTLHTLARDSGRQILYLSAQPEDAERWQRATGEAPRVIDLNRVRAINAESADALPLPEPDAVPEPDTDDPAAYAAALGVDAPNPRAEPGVLHLFHLLHDDLPTLHRLIADLRITTVGQAERLLEGTAARHLEAPARAMLERRTAAARAWVNAWRVGRGEPVDRPRLEESPMGKWKNLDALIERAEAMDGDPDALLASLREERLPGFGDKRIQQVEQWLEQEGALDHRPRLDASGRYHAVLASLPDTDNAITDARRVVDALEAATPADIDVQSSASPEVMPGW